MNITDPILLQKIKEDQGNINYTYSNQVYPGRWKAVTPSLGALVERLSQRVSIGILEEVVQQRDARPNISLTNWNSDYSKRPTQDQFNKEVQAKVKAEGDLLKEQNKVKQLEKDKAKLTVEKTEAENKAKKLELKVDNLKDQALKDKQTHTELQTQINLLLELKGEKQMSYQAIQTNSTRIKALQTLIKNLQAQEKEGTEQYNDLQNEYKLLQDLLDQKEELSQTLQKQINDLKEATKKPATAEMGTQTDLTAEQELKINQQELVIKLKELVKIYRENSSKIAEFYKTLEKKSDKEKLLSLFNEEIKEQEWIESFVDLFEPAIKRGSWKSFYEWLSKKLIPKDFWVYQINEELVRKLKLNWFNETTNRYYCLAAFIKSVKEMAGLPIEEEIKNFESYWKLKPWNDRTGYLVYDGSGSDAEKITKYYLKENEFFLYKVYE